MDEDEDPKKKCPACGGDRTTETPCCDEEVKLREPDDPLPKGSITPLKNLGTFARSEKIESVTVTFQEAGVITVVNWQDDQGEDHLEVAVMTMPPQDLDL